VSLGMSWTFFHSNIIGLADDAYHDENEEQKSHDEEDVGGGEDEQRQSGPSALRREHEGIHHAIAFLEAEDKKVVPSNRLDWHWRLTPLYGVVYDCSNDDNDDNNILSKPILPFQQA
jgi:hypothetical protein